ncbi:MAG: COX15/CtaA family protein [Gammaproteobacteria bacterium]|nr:COX15/CtaA family protein [Gammaproteobacteria bacterium]MBQ0839082.1 COX15/CtaA family protein [Gammaproteobacteria bacterium]
MPQIQSSAPRPGYRIALLATCLAAVVVMLGAFTRLSDAGLGCPDWPGCYGHLTWPTEAGDVARADALFPETPVDTDKTWPEMVHRYFASTLGLFIVALSVIAWRHREARNYPFRLPLFLLFLVVWQGMFGMWTVTLKLWPQVVTVHLLGGISTLSLLWLFTLRLKNQRWTTNNASWGQLQRLRPALIAGVVIVFIQVALGGWISSNYAAMACGDFPTCHGEWWPAMDLAQGFNLTQGIGPNYLGGLMDNEARVAIHMIHRVGALVTSLYLLGFCAMLFRVEASGARRMALAILVVLAVQVALGITNVLLVIPLSVAVLHNAGGALLLLSLVTLGTKIWMAEKPIEQD